MGRRPTPSTSAMTAATRAARNEASGACGAVPAIGPAVPAGTAACGGSGSIFSDGARGGWRLCRAAPPPGDETREHAQFTHTHTTHISWRVRSGSSHWSRGSFVSCIVDVGWSRIAASHCLGVRDLPRPRTGWSFMEATVTGRASRVYREHESERVERVCARAIAERGKRRALETGVRNTSVRENQKRRQEEEPSRSPE